MNEKELTFAAGGYVWRINSSLAGSADRTFWENPTRWFDHELQLFRAISPKRATVGKSNTLFRGAGAVVVKRYQTFRFADHVKNLFRRSRAEKCYDFAAELRKYGIATAEPLAVGTRRRLGFLRDSILVTRMVDDAEVLWHFRRDASVERNRQVRTIRQIAQILGRLSRLGFVHSDPSEMNFLIKRQSETIVLIDLDALRPKRGESRKSAQRNLIHTCGKLRLTPRERIWFAAEFRRNAGLPWSTRELIGA